MTLSTAFSKLVLLSTVLLLVSGGVASGQSTYTWIGGDGNWSDAGKWSPSGIPTASDTVRIDQTGTYVVTVDTDAEADWLVVGDGDAAEIVLNVESAPLAVSSSIVVDKGGQVSVLQNGPVTADSLIARGRVEVESSTVSAAVAVHQGGVLIARRVSTIAGSVWNDGFFQIQGNWFGSASAVLTVTGSIENLRTLRFYGNHSGTVVGTATLVSEEVLTNTGQIQSRGTVAGTHVLDASIDHLGVLTVDERNMSFERPGALQSLKGSVSIGDGRKLTINQSGPDPSVTLDAAMSITGAGEFEVNGGRVDIVDSSILSTGGKVFFKGGTSVHLASDFMVGGDVTIESSSLEGPGSLTVDGLLHMTASTINTSVTVAEGGRANVRRNWTVNQSFVNLGTTQLIANWFGAASVGASVTDDFSNRGTMVMWGNVSGTAVGRVTLTPSDTLVNDGHLISNGDNRAIEQYVNGILHNRGMISASDRSLRLSAPSGEHLNEGTMRAKSGSRIRLHGGSGLRHAEGSLLAGTGELDVLAAPGDLTTVAGAIGPGWNPGEPGALTVDGNLTMTPGAELNVDLAGIRGGTEHDSLRVTSTLVLDGILRIALPDTFDIAVGDTFNVVSAGTLVGEFAAVDQPSLMGKHLSVVYDGNVVRVITLSGGVASDNIDSEIPDRFALHGSYPNPFNPSTTISFDLPASSAVTITVYDMLGRRVGMIGPAQMTAGRNRSMKFESAGLPSGVYVYRLETGEGGIAEHSATRSFVVLK